jgi:hypothetical protein
MQEKLSVAKVYRNAFRFVSTHLFAFAFLTFFYFLGSLLPMFIGTTSFKVIFGFYFYLFFYFAAGCYYKQQILWDKSLFIACGVRFLSAVVFFLLALYFSSCLINLGINFVKISVPFMSGVLNGLFSSYFWLIGKYLFIFMVFVSTFIIPSFAFVSEITEKNRSLLITYIKTKGNILRIALVSFIAFVLLLLIMFMSWHINILVAGLIRSMVLVFVSILYFKMYDFFYIYPLAKKQKDNTDKNGKASKADLEGDNNAN